MTTKFKGWIEKLYVDATGQLVHRGEPLFDIYSPELYSAEVEYLLTLNQAPPTIPARPMLRETSAPTSSSSSTFPTRRSPSWRRRGSRARRCRFSRRSDGFVTRENGGRGPDGGRGHEALSTGRSGIVWVYAQIYEQDLPYIQLGQEAMVRLASLPDREFRGRVTYVYPNVDEKTRTARVRMEFHNPGYFLKPGMFVSVEIASELEPSALLVPDSAVLRSGEKNTVFVALPGGKFDPRTVALGPKPKDNLYQVLERVEGRRTRGHFRPVHARFGKPVARGDPEDAGAIAPTNA